VFEAELGNISIFSHLRSTFTNTTLYNYVVKKKIGEFSDIFKSFDIHQFRKWLCRQNSARTINEIPFLPRTGKNHGEIDSLIKCFNTVSTFSFFLIAKVISSLLAYPSHLCISGIYIFVFILVDQTTKSILQNERMRKRDVLHNYVANLEKKWIHKAPILYSSSHF